uniref:Retrotransposon protein, putative, unclassified n=1 Tax=Oryza sativa subsp. japonica TaxID=39947 RepID=Q2R357_ORYSJ|nr:retrotransposon protein, putative, unclassified [Oryza sativa Japonica Group]
MAEERESFESQWAPSDVTEENLKEMVVHGVLPTKEIIGWRPAFGKAFPTPDTHEIVPNKSKLCVVGGAGFQLRGTLSQKYFSMPFKTSNKGWHANWFYVQNPKPALPEYSCLPPVYQDTWNSLPTGDEAAQAVELMERMIKLKEQGLQGEQITWHFIKSRLAPIKERSRTAFEFDGKHDPNREDPDSLNFKIMKERMYKIFSNAIVSSNADHPTAKPVKGAGVPRPVLKPGQILPIQPDLRKRKLVSSDDESDTARKPGDREATKKLPKQATPRKKTSSCPVPKIRKSSRNNTDQPDLRKRKLVSSDDESDTARKPGDREATKKLPKQATPRKKTSSCPVPKIRKSSRKPSDIDPSGKDSDPTSRETNLKGIEPTDEDQPSHSQPATDNVGSGDQPPTENESAEAGAGVNQEPPTKNQSDTRPSQEIPEVGARADSPRRQDASNDPMPGSPIKVQESTRSRPEIITVDTLGPMIGDEEEIPRIQAAEDSHPSILVKWWDDDRQPQGIIINKQKEDEEVCLLKKALSQATRIVNRIHLRNEAKTTTLEKLVPHLGTLEATKSQLHEVRELARKTEHDLRNRISELQKSNYELSGSSKGARDKVANAATLLIQAMFFNNAGSSTLDASEIFDKLRVAPDTYFKNIREVGCMGASMALAMTKSLYPKIDIDAVDGFADGTSEETALNLINDAQKAADKIAADIVERFQDGDLRPTGSDNSDDEKTDTD